MTDDHCLWHPCTQALKCDWQEFLYESGGNELAACNDTSHRPASPNGNVKIGTEADISVLVRQHRSRGEVKVLCQTPLQWIVHASFD